MDVDCFKPQRADCRSNLMTCVLAKPEYLREAEQQLSEHRRACEHTRTQTHACIGVLLARDTTLSSRWRAPVLTLMVLGFSEASTISFSLFKQLRQKQHFKVVRAAAGAVWKCDKDKLSTRHKEALVGRTSDFSGFNSAMKGVACPPCSRQYYPSSGSGGLFSPEAIVGSWNCFVSQKLSK